VHSSTGYSPFQLLFGRDVRGPLSLLYEQLTEKTTASVTVTEYVETLKTRLREAWKLAAEHDQDAKEASKHQYNQKTLARQFMAGDNVLVMTQENYRTSGRDHMWWKRHHIPSVHI